MKYRRWLSDNDKLRILTVAMWLVILLIAITPLALIR